MVSYCGGLNAGFRHAHASRCWRVLYMQPNVEMILRRAARHSGREYVFAIYRALGALEFESRVRLCVL